MKARMQVGVRLLATLMLLPAATQLARGAEEAQTKSVTAEIRGQLVHEGTKAPVVDLQIWLGRPERKGGEYSLVLIDKTLGATTDATGKFSIKNVPPGTYGLLAGFAILRTAGATGHVDIVVPKDGGLVDLKQITVKKN